MPAKHVLETRSPHLAFMLLKDYWFRELYLGLKVAASFDRDESFTKTIDGQIRCITPEYNFHKTNLAWNVSYIYVFITAWMVPPQSPPPTDPNNRKSTGGPKCTPHVVRR